MPTDEPFADRFPVFLIDEHPSRNPMLINFKHMIVYLAAQHCGPSNSVYRVWFGPSELEFENFDEPDFKRYFREVSDYDPTITLTEDLQAETADLPSRDRIFTLPCPKCREPLSVPGGGLAVDDYLICPVCGQVDNIYREDYSDTFDFIERLTEAFREKFLNKDKIN